MTAFSCSACFS